MEQLEIYTNMIKLRGEWYEARFNENFLKT